MAPYVSPELLAHLREMFPDRCPSIADADRQIWVDAGCASVVAYMARLHDAQVHADLTRTS